MNAYLQIEEGEIILLSAIVYAKYTPPNVLKEPVQSTGSIMSKLVQQHSAEFTELYLILSTGRELRKEGKQATFLWNEFRRYCITNSPSTAILSEEKISLTKH